MGACSQAFSHVEEHFGATARASDVTRAGVNRNVRRLVYGLTELIFGFGAAVFLLWPQFSVTALTAAQGLSMIAALYVMVRGLDNIGNGLEGSTIAPWWKKLFH